MYVIETSDKNGLLKNLESRKTEKAARNYANRMFDKYGEQIKVMIYDETLKTIVRYEA